MSEIKRVCCVCKRIIGITEGYGVSGISHGYCPQHAAEAMRKLDVEEVEHNPEMCTDPRCEEPACLRQREHVHGDILYDQMRDCEEER